MRLVLLVVAVDTDGTLAQVRVTLVQVRVALAQRCFYRYSGEKNMLLVEKRRSSGSEREKNMLLGVGGKKIR